MSNTKGESVYQREEILSLNGRLDTVETNLLQKLDLHKYEGKVALLDANDLKHDADISRLETTTVDKSTFNTITGNLAAKDAIHDIRINTLEVLKDTKVNTSDYYEKMGLVDEIDDAHRIRIEALERGMTGFQYQIDNVINQRIDARVEKTFFESVKNALEVQDSELYGRLSDSVSNAAQNAIDAAQNAVISGKVELTDYNEDKTTFENNNKNWDKRLNAVDQYILAMLQTYQIKLDGVTPYTYTGAYTQNPLIEKKHFKIVGKKAPNTLVIDMEPFAFNSFYGTMVLHKSNQGEKISDPSVIAKKSDAVSTTMCRFELPKTGSMAPPVLAIGNFPLYVTLYNSAGDILQTEVVTLEQFQSDVALPMMLAPQFKYNNAVETVVSGISNRNFTPSNLSGGSLPSTGIEWRWSGYNGSTPPGMTLGAATGEISGTPTGSPGEYNVDVFAKNQYGEYGVRIKFVVIAVPTIEYTGTHPSQYYTRNTTIPEIVATATNTVNFTISPALPSGMYLNASTGKIYGTPTVVISSTTYTITAHGIESALGGVGTTTLTFAVIETAPAFRYGAGPGAYSVVLGLNAVMADIMPNIDSASGPINATGAYSVIGTALPTGISLNANTGKISGTPSTSYALATYTIQATGPGGFSTANISIEVKANVPTGSYNANNLFVKNSTIAPFGIQNVSTGISAPNSENAFALYNLAGTTSADLFALTGLSFNVNDGIISGTPNAVLPTTGFSVKVTGSGGVSAPMPFYITIKEPVPVIAYGATHSGTRGAALTDIVPTSATNSPTYYSITPLPPVGLNFNNSNGQITGTPLVTLSAPNNTFSVKAYNSGGEGSAVTFTLTIVEPAPEIAYNVNAGNSQASPLTYTVNSSIGSLTPSLYRNHISVWDEVDDLPDGLNLNTSNGQITGTPIERTPAKLVTIKASSIVSGLNDTFSFWVFVKDFKPVFSYPQSTYNLEKDVEITDIEPTLANNSVATGYTKTGELPEGLNFNTATGIISGTPIAVTGNMTVTVVANNTDESSVAKSITFNVGLTVPAGASVVPLATGSAGYEMKLLNNPADATQDFIYVRKVSGTASGHLAYFDGSAYASYGGSTVVAFANGDFHKFTVSKSQDYSGLAVVDADGNVLAAFDRINE